MKERRFIKAIYLGFGGGGFGEGRPVVSYAPRPMLEDALILVIMIAVDVVEEVLLLGACVDKAVGLLWRKRRLTGLVKSFLGKLEATKRLPGVNRRG